MQKFTEGETITMKKLYAQSRKILNLLQLERNRNVIDPVSLKSFERAVNQSMEVLI